MIARTTQAIVISDLPAAMPARRRARIPRVTVRRRKATGYVWSCRCGRCGHQWTSHLRARPTRCPRCKAHDFNKPARPYRRRKP